MHTGAQIECISLLCTDAIAAHSQHTFLEATVHKYQSEGHTVNSNHQFIWPSSDQHVKCSAASG